MIAEPRQPAPAPEAPRRWGGLRFRTKLLLTTVSVLGVAILVSVAILLHNHRTAMREAARADTDALAGMIAEYVAAAVVFEDADGARDILRRLASQQRIRGVVVYDTDGEVFAEFERRDAPMPPNKPSADSGARYIPGRHAVAWRPVRHDGQQLGTLWLATSTAEVEHRIGQGMRQVIIGCLALMLLCAAIAWRLQGAVTRPLLSLSAAMGRVSAGGTLDERVHHDTDDEVGTLYRGFNDMLEQIQSRSEERDRTRARLQALVDAIPDLIFVVDEDGTYLDVTTSRNDLLARPPEDVVGHNLSEVLQDEQLAREARASLLDALQRRTLTRLDYELQLDDGTHHFEAVFAPMDGVSPENKRMVLIVSRDTTERHRLEEQFRQNRKMEAVGQLAGGIAHDFNNLLTGIMGYAELMQLDMPDDERPAEIIAISQHASDLIRQLLAFSRRAHTKAVPTDLNSLVHSVRGILQRTVDRRIEVRVQEDEGEPAVMGDFAQLQSAILNLGVNARDAMPDGGVLTLSVSRVELHETTRYGNVEFPAGAYVELGVSDTGDGIPDDIRERIFEPFFTTKPLGKGTGLGLSAVYGTVQNHQGAVALDSTPGEGARFRILLPRLHRPAERSSRRIPRPELGTGRILLVDDEEMVRSVCQRMLQGMGYEVTAHADPHAALDIYRAGPEQFDLVVVDMIMPRMTGLELARELRACSPGVRILLASGYTDMGADVPPELQGIPFVQKPFTRAELANHVARTLRR